MIRRVTSAAALVAAATALTSLPLATGAPSSAPANDCSNVRLVFARGTDDSPGLGQVGADIRHQLGLYLPPDVSLTDHPVNYPATQQWATAVEGVTDARNEVVSTAEKCPDTKIVLGGYSQGAAVAGFVTADRIPDGVDPSTVPQVLTPDIASHVAAVILVAPPNNRAMDFLHQPLVDIGPLFENRTKVFCAAEDPVCSEGLNLNAHSSSNYINSGIADEAARYAAGQLGYPVPAAPPAPANDSADPSAGHLSEQQALPGPVSQPA